jgi:hypothetical protein
MIKEAGRWGNQAFARSMGAQVGFDEASQSVTISAVKKQLSWSG